MFCTQYFEEKVVDDLFGCLNNLTIQICVLASHLQKRINLDFPSIFYTPNPNHFVYNEN